MNREKTCGGNLVTLSLKVCTKAKILLSPIRLSKKEGCAQNCSVADGCGRGGKQVEPVQKDRGSPYYLVHERKEVIDMNVLQLEGDKGARSPQV